MYLYCIMSQNNSCVIITTEPVELFGEGAYNINVLKEIEATDSYLGLNQNVIECQNVEPLFNCTTRHYINSIITECGCLPFTLAISEKVGSGLQFECSLILH